MPRDKTFQRHVGETLHEYAIACAIDRMHDEECFCSHDRICDACRHMGILIGAYQAGKDAKLEDNKFDKIQPSVILVKGKEVSREGIDRRKL